ncbi:hypothetical protein [Nocardia terpenica]|uniref:SMP-30/Gluconolactonase/LRE-like region domain-containing protein n=1 Tax=Nocardia terpenica TaxID=455432 RepID=A0A6G9ZDP4_9NOCA|nr:hypothetical protein [Nocardia terpenica]QIS23521.1 hypothetical protein F6W96_39750 [Nocardia terpenica]
MSTELWPSLPTSLSADPVLVAFADALQQLVLPPRQALDALPRHLSAQGAPQGWLRWLCEAFGMRTEPDWDSARLRAALREGPLLAGTRGTADALCREALLVHGCVLGLADPGRVEASGGSRMQASSLARNRHLEVHARATAPQLPALHRLVAAHCPAWLPFTLAATTADTRAAEEIPLDGVDGVLAGPGGEVYVWQENPAVYAVWLVDPGTGSAARLAGTGDKGTGGNGKPAPETKIGQVRGLALGTEAQVILSTGHQLRHIDTTGDLTTLPVPGPRWRGYPRGMVMHPDGTLFVAEDSQAGSPSRVYAIDPSFTRIEIVAGPALRGSRDTDDADSQARAVSLNRPHHLALDAVGGTLYIADTGNHRVLALDLHRRTLTTVAGTGTAGAGPDGEPATQSPLDQPWSVATAADGRLFISEHGNHRVRVVDPDGRIRTVAGSLERTDHDDGDGRTATEALLRSPTGVSVDDRRGVLYITESSPGRVRQVDLASGIITAFAGAQHTPARAAP